MAVRTIAEVTVTDETDIDHLVTWYLRSTSPTKPSAPQDGSAPPSPWTSSEPGYDSSLGTTYLYTVTQTVWGDGSLTYGEVQLSSAYEAAKVAYNEASSVRTYATTEFQRTDAAIALRATKEEVDEVAGRIVGRNLFRGTKDAGEDSWNFYGHESVPESGVLRLTPTTQVAYAKYKVDYLDFAEYGSGTFTVSFDVRRLAGEYTDKRLRVILGFNRATRLNYVLSSTHDRFGSVYIAASEIGTDWTRVSATFDVPEDLNTGRAETLEAGSQLTFEPYLEASGNPVEIRRIKLERGAVATEWSEAPEDYADEQVSIARAEIKVTTDGITTEVEKKTDKATIISTINQSAETVKIQASKVEITGDAVFSAINNDTGTTKINGGKIDASSITIGGSNLATQSDVGTAVSTIEVGGRNLLRNSQTMGLGSASWTNGIWRVAGNADMSKSRVVISDAPVGSCGALQLVGTQTTTTDTSCFGIDAMPRDKGADYVISMYARVVGGGVAQAGFAIYSATYIDDNADGSWASYHTRTLDPTGEWTRIWVHWRSTAASGNVYIGGAATDTSSKTIQMCLVKIERGTKPTDWTPAPEDVAADISAVQDNLNASRIWYATCDSAASANKVATITPATTDFALNAGTVVYVKFANKNTKAVASLLLDVNGMGAKPVKAICNGALGNLYSADQIGANSTCGFIYDGTNWVMQENATDTTGINNALYRTKNPNAIYAVAACTNGHLICGTDSGYRDVAAGISFSLDYPLLYCASTFAATKTGVQNYLKINGLNLKTTGDVDGAAIYNMVYLKGTVSGNTFAVAASPFMTCAVPTTEDGYVYIPLGIVYSAPTSGTVAVYFSSSKDLYAYKDGAFGPVSIREASAAAKTATNYISADSSGIRIADADPATATTYQHQTATSTEFVVDGTSTLAIGGSGIRVGANDSIFQRITAGGMEIYPYITEHPLFRINARPSGQTTSGYDLVRDVSGAHLTVTFQEDGMGSSEGSVYHLEPADFSSATHLRVRFDVTDADNDLVWFEHDYIVVVSSTRQTVVDFSTSGDWGGPTITVTSAVSTHEIEYMFYSRSVSSAGKYEYVVSVIEALAYYERPLYYPSMTMGASLDDTQTGDCALAVGNGVVASGNCSQAFGYDTSAGGAYSHAHNLGTLASSDAQTAVGRYNVEDANDAYALIIGNGTADDARSNAFAVTWDGLIVTQPATADWSLSVDVTSATTHGCRTNGVMLTIYGQNITLASSLAVGGQVTLGTVPEGFRPPIPLHVPALSYQSNVAGAIVQLTTAGVVQLTNRSSAAIATSTRVAFVATVTP